jgi:CO/xanthine dehydrogenase Mo-binding subunit
MAADQPARAARRRFMLAGLAGSGALAVGWGLMPLRQRLHTAEPLPVSAGAVALNGWVAIAPDGSVSVVVPRSEMGQGVHTALPMLLAEELDVPLASVRIMQAPIDKIFGNVALMRELLPFHPDQRGSVRDGAQWVLAKVARELGVMFTGGSTSVKDAWGPMREAGALARAMLVAAAAAEWGVAAAECRTDGGFVLHRSGRRASYGSLAARGGARRGDRRRRDSPQAAGDFKLIGTAQPRLDSAAKVDGSAAFGIDARPAGLLYAAVRMAPVLGARVASFDAAALKAMPGVLGVVDFSAALGAHSGAGAGVAVIASGWWAASQAAAALPVSWDESAAAALSSAAIFKQFDARLDADAGHVYHQSGSQDPVAAAQTIGAEYRAPFLAHATMEPVNCTAQVSGGKVRLWVSTQVPSIAVDMAARVAGVGREDVTIEVMLIGGGFGRRLEVDMVAQAVAVAAGGAAGGRPVQTIWSRQDDLRHDVYRPAAIARFGRARRRRQGARLRQQVGQRLDRPPVFCARDGPARLRPRQERRRGRIRHAVRNRQPARGARDRRQRRAARLLALGRPFAQRVFQGKLHRRAGACRRQMAHRSAAPCWPGTRDTWRCWTRRWPGGARRRPGARTAWRCTSRSAASSRRWPKYRSKARRSACTGWCAQSTAASRSTPTSSPSRWSRRWCSGCRPRWPAKSRSRTGASSSPTSTTTRCCGWRRRRRSRPSSSPVPSRPKAWANRAPRRSRRRSSAVFALTGRRLRSLPLRLA